MREPGEPSIAPEPEPKLEPAPEPEVTPTIVLLHGLGRWSRAMNHIAAALEAADFPTIPIDYPTLSTSLTGAVEHVRRSLKRFVPGKPLHVVTHSLGGIIWRHLADPELNWRRGVLIAPPNQGSQVATALRDNALFQVTFGPIGQALANQTPAWPYPPAPFGIIAGTQKWSLINPTSWISPSIFPRGAPHDGTVSVDETRLPGAAGFITVKANHSTICDDPSVHMLTVRFLKTGAF